MDQEAQQNCSIPAGERNNQNLKKEGNKTSAEQKKEILHHTKSNGQTNNATYSLSDLQHVYNNCYNGSSNNGSNTATIPPHFYSPILGSQQPLLRPLMSTQPPLYSPILTSQQHSYTLPHPSPTAGCFSSFPESVRNCGIDALNCGNSNNTKDQVPNSRKSNGSVNMKSCELQDSSSFSSDVNSKRPQHETMCLNSQMPSCSELLKNNSLHEQRIFDEYIRMYGEEGSCRIWGESNNLCGPSSSSPSSCLNKIASQMGNVGNLHNYPDCRLDPAWNRTISTSAHPSCAAGGDGFVAENQSTALNVKYLPKNSPSSNSGAASTTDHNMARSHYEYQAMSASFLPYLQTFPYQIPEARADARQIEHSCDKTSGRLNESNFKKTDEAIPFPTTVSTNTEVTSSSNLMPRVHSNHQSNNPPNSAMPSQPNSTLPQKDDNQQYLNALHTLPMSTNSHHHTHTHQPSVESHPNAIQTSNQNVRTTTNLHHDINTHSTSSSKQNTNTNGSSAASHLSHTLPILSNQVPNSHHVIDVAQSSHISLTSNSNIQFNDSTHSTNAQLSLHHHSNLLPNSNSLMNAQNQINSNHSTDHHSKAHHNVNSQPVHSNSHPNMDSHSCANSQHSGHVYNSNQTAVPHNTHDGAHSSGAIPSIPNLIPDVNSSLTGKTSHQAATPSTSQTTATCLSRKYAKNQLPRCTSDAPKKRPTRDIVEDSLQNHNNFCLICGTIVDISCHSSVDTMLTAPAKMTVGEKLSFLVGHPLPRELLPSLAVCLKCFYIINEVNMLEQRLNICRREVLLSLENTLERNGVHLYLYKRLQSQQSSGYQSEGQPSHYPLVGTAHQLPNHSNVTLYQNDHHYQAACQGYLNVNSMGQQMQQFHGSSTAHFQNELPSGHATDVQVNLHPSQGHPQLNSNLDQIQPHLTHQPHPHDAHSTHNSHPKAQTMIPTLNKTDMLQHKSHSRPAHQHATAVSRSGLDESHLVLPHQDQQHIDLISQQQQQQHLQDLQLKSQMSYQLQPQNLAQNSFHQQNHFPIAENQIQNEQHPIVCQQHAPLSLTLQKVVTTEVAPQSESSMQTMQSNMKSGDSIQLQADKPETKPPDEDKQHKDKSSNTNAEDFVDETILLQQNNSVSLLLQETPEQLIQNPLSVLLPSYENSHEDNREYDDHLLVDTFSPNYENEMVGGPKEQRKDSLHSSYTMNRSTSTDGAWSEHCEHTQVVKSVQGETKIPNEGDIDIEKCDNLAEDAPASDEIHDHTVERKDSSDEEADCADAVDKGNTEVNQMDAIVPAEHEEVIPKDQNPPSPDLNNLDNLLSPHSHPPPPVGPPEGLRNVQDATEYHKPTLLGKNLKAKKHAKLQICRQCDQVFSNRQALIRHIERRHKSSNLSFSCDTCRKKFNSERTLAHHIQSHKTYPCKICSKIFLKKAKLKKHLQEHPQQSLVCGVCNKEMKSIQGLRTHVKTHDRQPKTFKCGICQSFFACKRNLDHHALIHTGEKPFKCENCKKLFRHQSNMIAHHSLCVGKYKYACPTCNRGFALNSVYQLHLLEHEDQFAHRCSVCHKGFSKPSDLRYHFPSHKDVSLTYPCEICGPHTLSNCNSKAKPFRRENTAVCPVCSKILSMKNSMKDHLAQHNGLRNHKCKFCPMAFFYRTNLNFHLKSIHYQKKPHRCSVCDKCFASTDNFKKHMRSHTGEKPYQCKSCGKAFSCNGNFKRHQKCHFTRPALGESLLE